ncbi:SHOCT domain-containing protein [Chengkuizengella axinellae]|uniref:SHOCT domain-containing protein n=1 Tax=Chengkuizengella axinellae TaxID=3064388 RepID=A0ABT9J612_9BACL|nr:SHOCT domain-containing protein [Chengkuizengella sp. 2205SS18-9]MDP5277056.1 SHOCT domain-containing protein [Chengkuizengella sp. 2205SS18-9]
MHWFDECASFQGGGMMMIGMFLFWGALIFLGFYLLKNYINGNSGSSRHMNILKERLAKGEISEEEYDRLKEKL